MKRAITLNAGRNRNPRNTGTGSRNGSGFNRQNGNTGGRRSQTDGNTEPIKQPAGGSTGNGKIGTDTKDEKPSKKVCFKCGKPGWKSGHKCEKNTESKQTSNTDMESDDGRSFAERLNDHLLSPELSVITSTEGMSKLLFTPVLINGIQGMALVDSGADFSYISKMFVQEHGLEISPAPGIIKGGNVDKMADRIGTVSVCIENGSRKVECIFEVTKIAEDRDIIIGLPQFESFGYRVEGVPIKKPETLSLSQKKSK